MYTYANYCHYYIVQNLFSLYIYISTYKNIYHKVFLHHVIILACWCCSRRLLERVFNLLAGFFSVAH